jgi:hypothetical protein
LPVKIAGKVFKNVPLGRQSLLGRLKTAGDRWNPEEKLWRVQFGFIRGDAELEDRILKD